MWEYQSIWCLSLICSLLMHSVQCAPLEDVGSVTSSKQLAALMYREMRGTGGCYKLLNATGPVGSQGAPDVNADIDVPLVQFDQLQQEEQQLTRDVAVLVPVKQSVAFMQQLSSDANLQQHVKGFLVDDTEEPSSYSTVGHFPGSDYAPYSQRDYVWNHAAGANAYPSSSSWFTAPAFLLSPEMAADARDRAAYNAKQKPWRKQYHARLKLTMTSGTSNSSACLEAHTCKPLGGYSVWAALPPLPASAIAGGAAAGGAAGKATTSDGRSIILVLAQMDSIDMFHDSIQGADAALSGLVAMLGALQVLHSSGSNTTGAEYSSYNKRIVFLALAGEPWGYMGSRRLLYEAAVGNNSTAGLDMGAVEKVIEVGQIGRLPLSGPATLFAHSQKGAAFGDTTSILTALTAAAQGEASSAQISVKPADAGNPGIPPSSLMSFLRLNSSLQGVVLTEFDQSFTNPYYGSRFDNGSTLNVDGIAGAAAVLGAALHRLAGGDPAALKINMSEVQQVVSSYVSCIIMPAPGYACPLASALMTAEYAYNPATEIRSYAPRQYIGVLQYMPDDLQVPVGKSNLARLLWNVMAFKTRTGEAGYACDPFQKRCPAGQVCAGWRASNGDERYLGKCLNATVQYVPSYSTRISCEACGDWYTATWRVTGAADDWNQQYGWPPDPMWTESDWPLGVPALQLYLHEARSVEIAVLIAGLLVTLAVAAASYASKVVFEKHIKVS